MRALLARHPRLGAALHGGYVELGVAETPLERWALDGVELLIKRDDLTSPVLGGNKVRVLELLLARAGAGTTLLTVGAAGSTHALAVAEFGRLIGATTEVITWPQERHVAADATAARLATSARVSAAGSVATAYLRAWTRRMQRRVHWVPAGGSVPLGALGQVSAALELADQLAREGIAEPDLLVVPVGSGGTAAGLLVGLALAGLSTHVVGVQVVPRIVANHRRVRRLARRTHALLSRMVGVRLPPLELGRFSIERGAYGGGYGRATADATAAAERLSRAGGPRLDTTYSAKAFAVALERARSQRVLFWLTFDGRWIGPDAHAAHAP